jgi:hypothetical protein
MPVSAALPASPITTAGMMQLKTTARTLQNDFFIANLPDALTAFEQAGTVARIRIAS